MKNMRPFQSSLIRIATATVCALTSCAWAQGQPRSFDIAGGELKSALDAYAAQAGAQIVYKVEDVKGLATKGVHRSLPAEEALKQLLEGTSLKVRRDASGAWVIYADGVAAPESHAARETQTLGAVTVVVTANRRREPARDVPMQVDTMSADQLARGGARSLKDYLADDPGVDLNSRGGPGIGQISVRGVTTGSQVSATVGMYVDDVAVGSSSAFANGAVLALDMALLDLNHIELLRGPQGTLYGAGAMGGLLKYVTNEPDTTQASGSATVAASSTRNGGAGSIVSGVVNLPLKEDVAALRVSAFEERAPGYVSAVGPAIGTDINRGTTSGARASLLIEPSLRFKVRLTATTQRIKREGLDYVDYSASTGAPVEGDLTRRLVVREPYSEKIDLYAADVEYNFGWARLNSVTSSQRLHGTSTADVSPFYVPLLNATVLPFLGLPAGIGFAAASIDAATDHKKTTQEVRLTSKTDSRIEWLAGLYWDREEGGNDQHGASTLTGGIAGPDLLVVSLPSVYKEIAAYGDVTWKPTEGFAVTGGLRVARNKQKFTQQVSGGILGAGNFSADSSDTSRTYLLTGRYAVTPTSSAYVRAATGYRPGGPNFQAVDPVTRQPLAPTTFEPDTLTSYEAGYKADLLDKRLSIQVAAYDIRWKKLQQPFSVGGLGVVLNAGAAQVRGAEFTAAWRPDAHWNLNASASFIDAKLSEDALGLGAAAGTRLPNSARASVTLGVNYAFTLAGRQASVGVTERYVGKRNAGFEGSNTLPNYVLPAYTLTDVQAGIEFGRFNVSAFVRNLFDKRAQLAANSASLIVGGPVFVSPAQPRTLGVAVNASF